MKLLSSETLAQKKKLQLVDNPTEEQLRELQKFKLDILYYDAKKKEAEGINRKEKAKESKSS